MANRDAILDKIVRNLKQRGIAGAARVGATAEVTKSDASVLVVTYVDKAVQAPMGGINSAVSPYLGIGVAAPGALKIKGAAGDTTLALILSDSVAVNVLAEVTGFANDVILESGDSTAELARIRGIADSIGLGS